MTGSKRNRLSTLHPTEGELLLLFFNIGNKSCVDVFYGPTHDRARSRGARRSSLQHLLRGAVRPVAVQNSIRRSLTREGPRRGKRVLSMLGRPARASSNAMETRKEQHVEIGKIG